MGAKCCMGDIFKMLFDKYGQEFVTLMVCEDGKITVTDQFGKVRTQFGKVFGNATNHANSIIDSKTTELDNLYNSQKKKIQAIPGAVSALEKSQGQPIDDLSGYNSLKGEINTVRKDTVGKMDSEKTTIEGKMKSTEDSMITAIENKRPKIQLYQDLPDPVRKDVIVTAQKEFATQIADNRKTIISSITGQFGPTMIQNAFSAFNPTKQLDSIVGGAAGKFASTLTSGSPIGNVGGFL